MIVETVQAEGGVNVASEAWLRQLRALTQQHGMLLIIVLMYIVLGFFIETLALMIATIPIVVPIVIGLGFDKVWFGILLIVLIEMALITPPVGLNLYVVQGARKEGRLSDVMVGAIPFVFVMLSLRLLWQSESARAAGRPRLTAVPPRSRKSTQRWWRSTVPLAPPAIAVRQKAMRQRNSKPLQRGQKISTMPAV